MRDYVLLIDVNNIYLFKGPSIEEGLLHIPNVLSAELKYMAGVSYLIYEIADKDSSKPTIKQLTANPHVQVYTKEKDPDMYKELIRKVTV